MRLLLLLGTLLACATTASGYILIQVLYVFKTPVFSIARQFVAHDLLSVPSTDSVILRTARRVGRWSTPTVNSLQMCS